MFAKSRSTGQKSTAVPLFEESRPGLLGLEGIKWNFTKFLVDRNGQPVRRYAPSDTPESLDADVAAALA